MACSTCLEIHHAWTRHLATVEVEAVDEGTAADGVIVDYSAADASDAERIAVTLGGHGLKGVIAVAEAVAVPKSVVKKTVGNRKERIDHRHCTDKLMTAPVTAEACFGLEIVPKDFVDGVVVRRLAVSSFEMVGAVAKAVDHRYSSNWSKHLAVIVVIG